MCPPIPPHTPHLPQMARRYCREVFEVLRTLKASRDMSVNEVKLVVSIEDPRTKVGVTTCKRSRYNQRVLWAALVPKAWTSVRQGLTQ